jgi:predicted amidophosphoribosyltransferase
MSHSFRIEAGGALLASLVVPPRCCLCGAPCSWREALCARCETALARARPVLGASPPPGLDSAWSAAPYEHVARELVAALKFRRRLPLARRAAEAIAAGAPPALLEGSLVPVPAAPWRLRARGMDPGEEIAFRLARLTGLPASLCLARADGPRQVGRPRDLRLADPPLSGLIARAPERAVLVDDVLTTGATLAACARALRAGGSRGVVAVTFARA